MRWLTVAWLCLAFACGGPSSTQVRAAKSARYMLDGDQLYDRALAVTRQTYKLGPIDAENRRFATAPQFYSAEGGRQSEGADGFVNVDAGSVQLTLVVEVVPADGGGQHVVVTPVTFQLVSGSPKPRELRPDDPNLPPWISGRVDALAVAIYEDAKPHAVTDAP